MKKRFLPMFLLCTATAVHAGGSGMFSLSLETDLLLSGACIAVNLGGLYFTQSAVPPETPDAGGIPLFPPGFPYDGFLDDAGTVLSLMGALALPLLLDRFCARDAGVIGAMYLETSTLAWGAKDLLKGLFPEYRPYVYRIDTPDGPLGERDRYFSFPSGHTTLAFATAAFCSYVFCRSSAKTGTKILFTAGSFSLAAATGVLRVVSGCHDPLDVAAGALLGTACGLAVPFLHKRSLSAVGDAH